MPEKDEPVKDVIISGDDSKFIHDLFRYESAAEFAESLETLFEDALWGLAHNGGVESSTPNKDIAKYNYHYSSLREVVKLLGIVYRAAYPE